MAYLRVRGYMRTFTEVTVLGVVVPLQGQKMMLGGYMPDDDVLVRSNFLTPLSMETQALYMRLLSGAD